MTEISNLFDSLEFRIWILPFDFAQGGELVEPFVIWKLVLGILLICDARVVLKQLNVHLIRYHVLARVGGYQMRSDRFWRYRGGERNFSRVNWSTAWPLESCRSIRSSKKLPVDPATVGRWPAEETRVISGNRSSVADTRSHGICEDTEQQPMEERICSWVVWCRIIGLLRPQHCIPQPALAIAPVAIKLAPKVMAKPIQMALMSNLFPEAPLFIVK